MGLTNYISTCYDKSGGLSHDALKTVLSAQIVIFHRTSSERQLNTKKRDGSR